MTPAGLPHDPTMVRQAAAPPCQVDGGAVHLTRNGISTGSRRDRGNHRALTEGPYDHMWLAPQ